MSIIWSVLFFTNQSRLYYLDHLFYSAPKINWDTLVRLRGIYYCNRWLKRSVRVETMSVTEHIISTEHCWMRIDIPLTNSITISKAASVAVASTTQFSWLRTTKYIPSTRCNIFLLAFHSIHFADRLSHPSRRIWTLEFPLFQPTEVPAVFWHPGTQDIRWSNATCR